MTAYALSTRGLTKRFPGVLALDAVDFGVRPGEVHALIGENGAGKSTLIKVLTGVYAPDEGEVRHRGEPASFGTPLAAQRAGISTIYQEVNLVPLMSVARNLFLGREPRGRLGLIDFARMHRESERTLREYGVHTDVRRPLGELGVGAQQMVALARAVSVDARVVVMDEPTSSLEPREVGTLFASSGGCAPMASPWSTSATASTSCTRCATRSPCCATGASCTPGRWRGWSGCGWSR